MSEKHTYFTIPFELVPRDPAYTVWFASWTAVKPRLSSEEEPRPFVIGVTKARLPPGATSLGVGRRSPSSLPPPPPSPVQVSLASYRDAFGAWLQTGSDTGDYAYFIIPFDVIPSNLADTTLWFATWSSHRPEIVTGMYPPFVVGVVSTAAGSGFGVGIASPSKIEYGLDSPPVPSQATILTRAGKDPPIPPPAAPVPGTSLGDYKVWLNDRSAE